MKTLRKELVQTNEKLLRNGESIGYRRVYRDGVIVLHNLGEREAKLLALWMTDIHTYKGESQFTISIEPGQMLEFDAPRDGRVDQFLDTLVLDHVAGSDVMVTSAVPTEYLN